MEAFETTSSIVKIYVPSQWTTAIGGGGASKGLVNFVQDTVEPRAKVAVVDVKVTTEG